MISVILYGRNDSYGYNLHKRGAISFNCIAEVLTQPDDEIIFVDTNTPDDVPTFPEAIRDTLTPRAKELLRVLRVRPATYERHKNGTRMKVLEPLCRNVGIRRSNPRNRWVLNSNTDMVFVPVRPGQALSEVVADLPDALYELPRFEMPEMLWESVDRAEPQAIIEQFKLWGRRLHINEVVLGNPENVFDGPGDFQLAPRHQLFAIHGMNEQMVLGWHVDSNLARRLFLLNGKTQSLLERYHAYHCDHTRVNTMMHTAEGGTANDWRKFVNEVSTPYLPEQAKTWGMPEEQVEEIRLTDQQARRYHDVLGKLLPGLHQPMLQSALLGESFNHGLLYDNEHVLPYITDHLSQIPPGADIGYLGGNLGLLQLIAAFRQGFGHTGRVLYDPAALKAGHPVGDDVRSPSSDSARPDGLLTSSPTSQGLPATCVPTDAEALYQKAFLFCFDLWMGNFETRTNSAGYSVPKASDQAGRFVALMMGRLHEFARKEKQRYDANPQQTKKFLFLGTQNTWFENAASQLISIVLAPYSSYVRHGMVRKDAFTRPFLPVGGHDLFLGEGHTAMQAWAERRLGRPVRLFDFELARARAEALMFTDSESPAVPGMCEELLGNPLGQPVLELLAFMCETDGQLAEAARLRQLLALPPREGERPREPHSHPTHPPARVVPSAPVLARRPPSIGIDIRTLFYSDSAARGVGHYTRYHIQALARCRPDWQFVLFANSSTPTPALEPLLVLPNIRLKRFQDYQPGEVDLFHIPDPLCLKPDFLSPMKLLPEVPSTVTFHDLAGLRLYLNAYKPAQRWEYVERIAQLLDPRFRLLSVSEFTRRDLVNATGLAPESITPILAGLNQAENPAPITPAFIKQVRAKYGINRRFLLHVGALDPHKNFETVIQVLARLKAHNLQLVVVGEKEHFLKQVADYVGGLGMSQIIFPGFIPRADLEALYRDAVGLVFLSLYEGFGFPVLEAMAQGCPVITSKVASLPEVAGDAALLVAPNDFQGAARAVEQLLTQPALRQALAQKGRARAAEFSWEQTARKTLAVWEEMLSVRSVGADRAVRPVLWFAPWQNPSGYCSEALAYARGLAGAIPLQAVDVARTRSGAFLEGLPAETRRVLSRLLTDKVDLAGKIAIQHLPGSAFTPTFAAVYDIGRTMFETDRLPQDWVTRCNLLDEIWVPSQFNLESFAASGVARDKLIVMPQAVDEDLFNPETSQPLPLPQRAAFNFLSVFEWSSRKAWDVLLAGYLREFSAEDDVCLYLRTYLVNQPDADPRAVLEPLLRQFAATLGLGHKPLPRVEILGEQIPTRDLPRLYRAVDCLVAPSHGEGWGRPHHEAMMMGLPVIATNWSGNTEFMNEENSFPLNYKLATVEQVEPGFAHYRGHRWAQPSQEHLRQLMRQVQQNPEAGRAKGLKARQHMLAHFSLQPVAKRVLARLVEIEARLTTPACPAVTARALTPAPLAQPEKLNVAWEGSFLDYGSLSHVNRELTTALTHTTSSTVTCIDTRQGQGSSGLPAGLRASAARLKAQSPAQVQVTVRHEWPPRWSPPASGAWVIVQPWEYGALPAEWVQQLQAVDEVWVPSEYVRRVYVDSGVTPAKVHVVPNGVDPQRFHPGAAPMPLPTKKSFKFLFVGGTIHRKGPDVLLEAYLQSFTAADDVCLVIKDFGGQSVYAGQTLEARIRAAQARPGAPEILYLNQELPPEALPGLYTACDCLLHPYRGEGFGLPVLEAMACGLPVVVTGGGSTDDFADDAHAYRIPALRRHFGAAVSGLKLARAGWLLEPHLPALVERMQWVAAHREEARAKGRQASAHVRQNWTWDRAARIAEGRLQAIALNTKHFGRTTNHQPPAGKRQAPSTKHQLPACALVGYLGPAREILRQGKLAEAWAATLEALKLRPFHPEAALLLAEIALAAGDSGSARRCAQYACDLAPEWKPARKFLKGKLAGNNHPAWLILPGCIAGPEGKHQAPSADGKTPNTKHQTPTGNHQAPSTKHQVPPRAPRISVCLIAKNEEQFLAQCLASVKGLADQIIVVDTGSTDRTVAIAQEHGAEVYHFEWCDDFSAARNAALERATGDWVLVLDADEELPPESHEPLRRLLGVPSVMAWRLPIIDLGREAEGCSYVPRLFRNAPALFYVGRVHEQVFSSLEVRRQEWGLDNRLGDAALRHHGYQAQVVKDRNKVQRNLALLERAIREMPGEPSLLMNYGLELTRSGQAEAGLQAYRQAFELMSAQPASLLVPETREMLLSQLSTQLMAQKRFDELVQVLTSPLAKAGGLTASLHFSLGLAHLERKEFAEAAAALRHCLEQRAKPSLSPINLEIRKAGPAHCLALCLERLGQSEPAAQAFRQALQDDPQSRPARLDFARFLAAHNQPVEALNLLFALAGEQPQDTAVWRFGAQLALSRPEFLEVALDWTAQAQLHAPNDSAILQQRAEVLTLSGQCEAALALWRQLPAEQNPALAAPRVLCETIREENRFAPTPESEPLIAREFLKWYRRLVHYGQRPTIEALNARLDRLERILPSAARPLAAVVAEALGPAERTPAHGRASVPASPI